MGRSKRAIAFGLAAAVGVGGMVRCSTVMERPEGLGLVDRALLSIAFNTVYPSVNGMEAESAVTRAVFDKLSRTSSRKETIRNYLNALFPNDESLRHEPVNIGDYFRIAQAMKKHPDGVTSIPTDELRGLYLYVLAVGGDKHQHMTALPKPDEGTEVLAGRVYKDVADNYVSWFSSLISNVPQEDEQFRSKRDNFLSFFVGHPVTNDASVMTAYTFPISEQQKDAINRKIVEGYVLNRYYSNSLGSSKPQISSLIAGLAASFDTETYRSRVKQISGHGGLLLDCALKNMYVANLYDGDLYKEKVVANSRERADYFFQEASLTMKGLGYALGGEETAKALNAAISTDMHIDKSPSRPPKYDAYSFGCFLMK